MGKKHRKERQKVKSGLKQLGRLKQLGIYETELGELRVRTTKADARRRLLRAVQARNLFEKTVCNMLSEAVSRDIDEEILASWNEPSPLIMVVPP
jgi:hypothetical protein